MWFGCHRRDGDAMETRGFGLSRFWLVGVWMPANLARDIFGGSLQDGGEKGTRGLWAWASLVGCSDAGRLDGEFLRRQRHTWRERRWRKEMMRKAHNWL